MAANTLLQRLGDDEVLARTRGSLETARLVAIALGSAAVAALVALRWSRLRAYEMGAPVAERHFSLLRADSIFAPLPLATLERLTHDLVELEAEAGRELITQGDFGDRFYLIDAGRVEVIEDGVRCAED